MPCWLRYSARTLLFEGRGQLWIFAMVVIANFDVIGEHKTHNIWILLGSAPAQLGSPACQGRTTAAELLVGRRKMGTAGSYGAVSRLGSRWARSVRIALFGLFWKVMNLAIRKVKRSGNWFLASVDLCRHKSKMRPSAPESLPPISAHRNQLIQPSTSRDAAGDGWRQWLLEPLSGGLRMA